MNIPIFRSYELDTAFLIEGSYIKENGFYMNNTIPDYNKPVVRHKICDEDGIYHEVSKDYLAINFPDMLDNQGNKIFASLSEDGKGGDIVEVTIPFRKQEYKYECYVYYKNTKIRTSNFEVNNAVSKEIKVIGIQK